MESLIWAEAQSVRRMYEDGLSCERIARHAGQPIEVVRKYLRLSYREPDDDGLPWAEQRRSPNAESKAALPSKSGPYKRRDTGGQGRRRQNSCL